MKDEKTTKEKVRSSVVITRFINISADFVYLIDFIAELLHTKFILVEIKTSTEDGDKRTFKLL